MSFRKSSRNIRLIGTTLHAECGDGRGGHKDSELRLDRLLGNISGNFVWLGSDFNVGALSVRLDGTILRARLPTEPETTTVKKYQDASIDLDERICNEWGSLSYADYHVFGFYSPLGKQNETNEQPRITQRLPDSWIASKMLYPGREHARMDRYASEMHHREVLRVRQEKMMVSKLKDYRPPALSAAHSIRLLKLEHGEDLSAAVTCSVEVVDLGTVPPYRALSYTWGNPFHDTKLDDFYNRTTSIICNGQRLPVRQNLFDALQNLRRGKASEKRGAYRKTPLIQAAEDGHTGLVQNLTVRGADLFAQDCFGETALHYAAENDHRAIVEFLVYHGSSLTMRDNTGRTPLDCAKQRKHSDRNYDNTIKFLEDFESNKPLALLRAKHTAQASSDYIWVDAICIDQTNDLEKAQQVALMGKIYSKASSVVVWLGREKHMHWDTSADDFLRESWRLGAEIMNHDIIDAAIEVMLRDPKRHRAPSLPAELQIAFRRWLEGMEKRGNDSWLTGISFLRDRRWFERAWILQEVIQGRSVTVVCGEYSFPWDTYVLLSCVIDGCVTMLQAGESPWGRGGEIFHNIIYRTMRMAARDDKLSYNPCLTFEMTRRMFQQKGPLSPIHALSLSRNATSADARDKVYAVLSTTSVMTFASSSISNARHWYSIARRRSANTQQQCEIVPDYRQSTRDLYINTSKSLLETYGPSILSFVGTGGKCLDGGLPSWVIDWTVPVRHQLLGFNLPPENNLVTATGRVNYNATGRISVPPTVSFILQSCLLLHGKYYDSVEQITTAGLNNLGPNLAGLKEWGSLISYPVGSPGDKLESLWRTVLADDAAGLHPAPDLQESFIEWLKFLSLIQIIGLEQADVEGVGELPHADHVFRLRRSKEEMIVMVDDMDHGLTSLGAPELTNEERMKWQAVHEWLEIRPLPWDEMVRREEIIRQKLNTDFHGWYFGLSRAAKDFGNAMRGKDLSRKLIRTKGGSLGNVPEQTKPGDSIFIIAGTFVPYILRREPESASYKLVGEAYIHGIMQGEAVANPTTRYEEVTIA